MQALKVEIVGFESCSVGMGSFMMLGRDQWPSLRLNNLPDEIEEIGRPSSGERVDLYHFEE